MELRTVYHGSHDPYSRSTSLRLRSGGNDLSHSSNLLPQPPHPQSLQDSPLTPTIIKLQYGVKYRVKLSGCLDGDTIDVEFPNGQVERIRKLGVDTPLALCLTFSASPPLRLHHQFYTQQVCIYLENSFTDPIEFTKFKRGFNLK